MVFSDGDQLLRGKQHVQLELLDFCHSGLAILPSLGFMQTDFVRLVRINLLFGRQCAFPTCSLDVASSSVQRDAPSAVPLKNHSQSVDFFVWWQHCIGKVSLHERFHIGFRGPNLDCAVVSCGGCCMGIIQCNTPTPALESWVAAHLCIAVGPMSTSSKAGVSTPHLCSPQSWLRTAVNVAFCASPPAAASPIACILVFRGFRGFVLCVSTLYW